MKNKADAIIPLLEKELKDVFNVAVTLEAVPSHAFGQGWRVTLWSEDSSELHQLLATKHQEFFSVIEPKIKEWSEETLKLAPPTAPFKVITLFPA